MISAKDFYVFSKWIEAPTGAFGIKGHPAVVPPEDKEAYWRIHSELMDSASSALDEHRGDGFFLRPKNYSRERGSRGHRPVDLWVSICGEGAKAFGFMPQVYAIASERGLEVGFAASIPESDYFDPVSKSRNRSLVPLINARLPDPSSAAATSLGASLADDGRWVFSTQTRLVPGVPGYDFFGSLAALLASLKSQGAKTGGGCIARLYSPEELESLDLKAEFRLALDRFRPLLKLAKPSNWDLEILEGQLVVEELGPTEPFDPDSIEDGRRKVFAEIARRQGQNKFRSELFKVYGGACAVCGCDVADVLQAAHISPYMGPQTNQTSNGLLLRADIHTLFDLGLIRVHPSTRQIVVSAVLDHTIYQEYHGKHLALPSAKAGQPSALALQSRWDLME